MHNKDVHSCKGIEFLNGAESQDPSEIPPIWYRERNGSYAFACCEISFCPACGTFLGQSSVPFRTPNSNDFCCRRMEFNSINPSESDMFDIFYQPFARRYFFSTAHCWRKVEPEDTVFPEWDFSHCLYCGKKLPEPLLELWLQKVKEEFGVERMPILENMLPLIPEEFRTDAWWKNRGL